MTHFHLKSCVNLSPDPSSRARRLTAPFTGASSGGTRSGEAGERRAREVGDVGGLLRADASCGAREGPWRNQKKHTIWLFNIAMENPL